MMINPLVKAAIQAALAANILYDILFAIDQYVHGAPAW